MSDLVSQDGKLVVTSVYSNGSNNLSNNLSEETMALTTNYCSL